MKRIGIDVGGTNTDAVLMDGSNVLKAIKCKTSKDISTGVTNALNMIIRECKVKPGDIQAVMLGTTHFTNAIIEGRNLSKVAIVRIGLPSTLSLEPMADWPEYIKKLVKGTTFLCHGGIEFNGRDISKFRTDEIERIVDFISEKNINSVAITSVFSPVSKEHEMLAADIISKRLPECYISLSSEIGKIGLLQRENATILNACLRNVSEGIIEGLKSSLKHANIKAPLFISQNDGTLMSADHAKRNPVMTFASGATNSLRGAAYLTSISNCVVVDIGGTTSDVGIISKGFPVEAPMETKIGGIRCNFRMPNIVSIGIGGGSIVNVENVTVGPESVGYKLQEHALIFGGNVLTASDLAVASGLSNIGSAENTTHLSRELIRQGMLFIEKQVLSAVDNVLRSRDDIPLVLVGGGNIILSSNLPGFSCVIKPEHAEVANAIGTSIAQVSGEVDKIYDLSKSTRKEIINTAKNEAIDKAVSLGASIDTIEILEIEEIPMTYLPGNSFRLKVKAVGDLSF